MPSIDHLSGGPTLTVKPKRTRNRPFSRSKKEIGNALAALASGSSPEQIAPTLGVSDTTIRRWHQDPRVAEDSEIAGYAYQKIRELTVTLAELAEDAAVALGEFIAVRDATGMQRSTWSVCTLTDKVILLIGRLDSTKVVQHATSSPSIVLDISQPPNSPSDSKQE